jgi:rhodanese-related sulfurtransferase
MFEVEVPNVSPTEAQDLVAQGWALIDVRTDEEWADGHIAGAQHLPMNEVVAKLPQIGNQVICVCAVGGRSWRVTQYLALQGLDAVNLDGGMQGWAAAGLPVER